VWLQPPTAEAAVEIILICQQPGMLPAAESAVHKKCSVALLV
jgi:hypothetical protein